VSPPFADVTARQVRLFRALVFGMLAADALLHALGPLAGFPPELVRPVGLVRLLPDAWVAALFASPGWLSAACAGACALAAAGPGFRALGVPVCLVATLHASVARSYAYVSHTDAALLLSAWAFAALSWADALPRGRPTTPRAAAAVRGAPLLASFAVLLVPYHLVGLTRVVEGGLEVFTSDALRGWMVRNAILPSWRTTFTGGLGHALAQHEGFATGMKLGFPLVTAFEVLAPAALFWRRFRLVFLAVMIPFHVVSLPVLGVFFYHSLVLLVALSWLDRGGPRRGGVPRPEPDP